MGIPFSVKATGFGEDFWIAFWKVHQQKETGLQHDRPDFLPDRQKQRSKPDGTIFFIKLPIGKLQIKEIGVCIFQRGSGYVILPVRK